METRIRRYFAFRKLNSKPLKTHLTKDDLDLIGVPYESTHKGRAPILTSGPRNRETARTQDDLDTLAMRTFPYESTVAGAPPVIGATPIKGNGPVKLQTSRRLSSGELLVTTQDHQRTLTDIRDGEYIVGRKEPKRVSKTISIRLPIHSRASSPRASFALAAQKSTPSREQSPRPERKFRKSHIPDPIAVDKDLETVLISAPEVTPRSQYSRNSSAGRAYILGPAEIPLPLSPGRPPSSRTSLLSKGEEQNATIQALWKAEYARLVAIYGQDGVDRNIAELNKDRLTTPPDKRQSGDTGARNLSAAAGPVPQPPVETIIPPPLRSPRGSIAPEVPFADNGSDYSSVKVPSLLSSEESSSSYTRRTSLFESDIPTTRDEVSRIVENMRRNYLKALESQPEEKPKVRRPRKTKQRASYTQTPGGPPSAPSKNSKPGRQSWHASTVPTTPKQGKQPRKEANSRTKTPRQAIGPLKTTASKSSLTSKPQLHRADSNTLGSFLASRRGDRGSPSPARTLKPLKPGRLPTMAQNDDFRPPTTESASSRSSSDNIAPEIDDFDIFYQDLALEFGPLPNNVKPALPALYDPNAQEIPTEADDAAPPPPNIDCTPRQHPLLAVI
jgi:hypothetical protein